MVVPKGCARFKIWFRRRISYSNNMKSVTRKVFHKQYIPDRSSLARCMNNNNSIMRVVGVATTT